MTARRLEIETRPNLRIFAPGDDQEQTANPRCHLETLDLMSCVPAAFPDPEPAILPANLAGGIGSIYPNTSVSAVPLPAIDAAAMGPEAAVWTLRSVRDRMKALFGPTLKRATWAQYQTIVLRWERFHKGPGPDVRSIDQAMLMTFFQSCPDWNSEKTWTRIDGQLGKLLKTCCPVSRRNRLGMETDPVIPSIDNVPFVVIPEVSWFKQRALSRTAPRPRRGHVPKRRGELTLDSYQRVIDACWPVCGLDAAYMETCLAWFWWSGMRFKQTLEQLPWSDGISDGVCLDSMSLVTEDSKCGGEIRVPIPSVLVPGLKAIRGESNGRHVFYRKGLKDRAWRKLYAKIWEHAFPCSSDTERFLRHWHPHQIRAVSVSTWDHLDEPACHVGWMVTGHSPGSVRQAAYSRPSEDEFRRIVDEMFPMPRLRSGVSQRLLF